MTKNKLPENLSLKADQQSEFEEKVKDIKKKGKHALTPGVIYMGHIPHGFFEEQMRDYFSQFGKVNRLRIARSKKTGKIKGYAFIEFECDEVAKVVAQTMNNYLMFHKLLKCEFLPLTRVHPETFKGSERKFSRPKRHVVSIRRHNRKLSTDQETQASQKRANNMKKKLAKLKEKGIDYTFSVPEPTVSMGETSKLDKAKISALQEEALHVLYEDSSDNEITFITPPNSVKSTKLKSGASTGTVMEERPHDRQPSDTPVTTTTPSKIGRTRQSKRKAEEEKQTVQSEKIATKKSKGKKLLPTQAKKKRK